MPLPKMPAKRGDVLTDYGPEADLTKPAAKAKPKSAKPAQASAAKPARRAVKKSAAADVVADSAALIVLNDAAAKPASLTAAGSSPKTAPKPSAKARGKKTASAEQIPPAKVPAPVQTEVRESKHANRRGRAATPADKRKLFVLDTNVLIHDPMSIFSFAEHDVFLPMTVLEELDNHKKGTSDVARNARSVSRNLDQLMELNGSDLTQGVPLSLLGNKEATGRLFFETHAIDAPLPEALPTFKGDNRILSVVKGAGKGLP